MILNDTISLRSFSLLVAVLLAVFNLGLWSRGYEILPLDPESAKLFTAAEFDVTRSLWENKTFEAPAHRKLFEHLIAETKRTHSHYWQDVFSPTVEGKLYPFHSLLVPVLAIPFFAVFGELGYWILAQLLIFGVYLSFFKVTLRTTGRAPTIGCALLGLSCSPMLLYCFTYTYDLLGAVLVVAALPLIFSNPFVANFLAGLSVFCRPSQVLFLPFILGSTWIVHSGRTSRLCALLGVIIPCLAFMMMNKFLWGGLLVTAYHVIPAFRDGQVVPVVGQYQFSFSELFSNWKGKLLDAKAGLIFHPALFAVPFLLAWFRRSFTWRKEDLFSWCCFFGGLTHFAIFYSYNSWAASDCGSRYLLGASFYLIMPAVMALQRVGPDFQSPSEIPSRHP